jgi:hypothetical protein
LFFWATTVVIFFVFAVGKTEAVKPPRGLTKQKAVVSLKNVVQEQPTRIMPKRKSAEKSAEPMEISRHEDLKVFARFSYWYLEVLFYYGNE